MAETNEPNTVMAELVDVNEQISDADVAKKLLPVMTTGIPGLIMVIPVGNAIDVNVGVATMVNVSVDGRLVATVCVPLIKVKMMVPAA